MFPFNTFLKKKSCLLNAVVAGFQMRSVMYLTASRNRDFYIFHLVFRFKREQPGKDFRGPPLETQWRVVGMRGSQKGGNKMTKGRGIERPGQPLRHTRLRGVPKKTVPKILACSYDRSLTQTTSVPPILSQIPRAF